MTKQLAVYNGGRTITMKDVYEIHTAEGNIVDVMRFDSPEEAAEFEKGIVGDYRVKPHTLSAGELLHKVLDLRIDEMLDEARQRGSGLGMNIEVTSLIAKIKSLPEFQAKFKPAEDTIFNITVASQKHLHGDRSTLSFESSEITICESLGGERIVGNFRHNEDEGFSYRNKYISESEVLQKIQASMQKFAGIPIDGYFQAE